MSVLELDPEPFYFARPQPAPLSAALEQRKYRVIYADPPWRFRVRKFSEHTRAPRYHTMRVEELLALPVGDLAARDCWLFLWTSSPHFEIAFQVAKAWGFRYSSRGFVWLKLLKSNRGGWLYDLRRDLHIGSGYTTRKNAEDCLLFRRGTPKRIPGETVHETIVAPLRGHSRKPDEARERIERFAPGPYCELFSRDHPDDWPGWAMWGNEVGAFRREGRANNSVAETNSPPDISNEAGKRA